MDNTYDDDGHSVAEIAFSCPYAQHVRLTVRVLDHV